MMTRDQKKLIKLRAKGNWVLCLGPRAIFHWGTEAECRAHLAEIAGLLPAGMQPELLPPI